MTRRNAGLLLALYVALPCVLVLGPLPLSAFDTIHAEVSEVIGGWMTEARFERLANVALFVPAGFLVSVLLRRPVAAVLLLTSLSALAEVVQFWLPGRYPSFGDVLANGAGAVVGALISRDRTRRT